MKSITRIRTVLKNLLRIVVFAVIGGALTTGTVAWAAPSDKPNGVPAQLDEVIEALAHIQLQLDGMQNGIGQNAADLEELTLQMHAQMDELDASTEDVFQSVNSVEVTSQLCFDVNTALGIKLGGVGEFGASWTKVLHAEIALELEEFWNLDAGVGSEFCIDVPIYSAFMPELEVAPDDGDLLWPFIVGTSYPGRESLAILGSVSEQLLPPAGSVQAVLADVEAALSGDPEVARNLLSPTTYTPMTPPLMVTLVETGAELVLNAVLYPCVVIGQNPLFSDLPPETYDFMCVDSKVTMKVLTDIASVVELMFGWL